MADLGLSRGYVVNLSRKVTEISRGIVMTGLRELFDILHVAA